MYKVEIKNPCNCFNKSGLVVSQEFQTKESAKDESEFILRIMKSNFCQKHIFELSEDEGNLTIEVKSRA